jgi:hypothetical protein
VVGEQTVDFGISGVGGTEAQQEVEERPENRRPATIGFPFLRAPWKRGEPPRLASPTKLPGGGDSTNASIVSTLEVKPDHVAATDASTASTSVDSAAGLTRIAGASTEQGDSEDRGAIVVDPTDADQEWSDDCEVAREVPFVIGPLVQRDQDVEASTTEDGSFRRESCEEEEEVNEDNLPDEEKAAREWERYRAANRSLIVDIFEGQLRSQLICRACGATSSTFEPFRYLSVPIPSNHVDRATLKVVFFPIPYARGEERPNLARYTVTVPKSSSVERVEKALSRLLPVSMSNVLLAEVYRSRIHRYLDSCLPLTDVRAEDQLFAFECQQSPDELLRYQELYAPSRQRRERLEEQKKVTQVPSQPRVLLIQAMHRRVVDVCRSDGRTWAQRREVFGLPFVMSACSTWTYATLHDMLMLHARRFLRPTKRGTFSASSMGGSNAAGADGDDRVAQMPFVARIVNASGTACGACDRRNCTGCLLPKGNARLRLRAGLLTGALTSAKIYLALDWVDSAVYDQEYVDCPEDVIPEIGEDRDDAEEAGPSNSHAADGGSAGADEKGEGPNQGPGVVPISACIDAFAQPEELKKEFGNGIKCDKCGEVVDAVKKLEIWREPDVLIMHIKRFQFTGVHYEKLNTSIEVPCRELSLRPWIVGPSGGSSAPYELYAVACHYGGMSGGHYTSFCANNEGTEPVWLKYNDEAVTGVPIGQEFDEIQRQCYVLFYRKRAFSSSNLINYSSLL